MYKLELQFAIRHLVLAGDIGGNYYTVAEKNLVLAEEGVSVAGYASDYYYLVQIYNKCNIFGEKLKGGTAHLKPNQIAELIKSNSNIILNQHKKYISSSEFYNF